MSTPTPPVHPAKKLALVTGASSGIGRDFCRLLAADGYDVVAVARRAELLESLRAELEDAYRGTVHAIAQDLLAPNASEALVAELAQRGLHVDLLVNNAGFGAHGRFVHGDLGRYREMLQLNCGVPMELSHRLLPAMLARGRGGIINVASTAAFQPGPYLATYFATKSFVLHLSEAIAEETRGTGVHVSALCPGPTRTEFMAAAGWDKPKLFSRVPFAASREVARYGYASWKAGRAVAVPGLGNRALATVVGFLPRALVVRFIRKVHELTA